MSRHRLYCDYANKIVVLSLRFTLRLAVGKSHSNSHIKSKRNLVVMDLSGFPFRLLSVFETCLILVHFNLLISSSPVNSLEIQGMKNLQKYGYINESRSDSASIIGQKAVQKAIKEFQEFSETPKTDRQKREAATPKPDLCQNASIDAATTTADGKTYVFKGDYYWELTGVEETRIADGYPRKISEDWGGLPGNLDAAVTWVNGKSFFFKENEYWKFKNKEMDSGYPVAISVGFTGIPDSVDAAFLWGGNGKTYFFKGSEYWRYKYPNDSPDSISYPLPINSWEGLPNNIDAALPWTNNQTYFFKEYSYYRFDDGISSVPKEDPAGPYPRSSAVWWFGCQDKSTKNEDLTTVSLDGADVHPTHIDEDDSISSSTQYPTENYYVESSEKLNVDSQQNGGDDSTTPFSEDELLDTNSAASVCASLLFSLLLVALLKTQKC